MAAWALAGLSKLTKPVKTQGKAQGLTGCRGAPGPHHTQDHFKNEHGGWAKALAENGAAGCCQVQGDPADGEGGSRAWMG